MPVGIQTKPENTGSSAIMDIATQKIWDANAKRYDWISSGSEKRWASWKDSFFHIWSIAKFYFLL